MAKKSPALIRTRIRVMLGEEIALGPGKVELLEVLRETGSITQAAAQLEMSYMRAWTLIRTMNRCFKSPVVAAMRGGTKGGGGAQLTETGIEVLKCYRRMNVKSVAVIQADWRQLQKLLRR